MMPRADALAAASLTMLVACVDTADLRKSVVITDDVGCAECQLSVRTLTYLGAGNGPGSIEEQPLEVVLGPHGRYWVTGAGVPTTYNENGKFIAAIGRGGQGPGEFVGPCQVRFYGRDSIFVFDYGNGRISILDPQLDLLNTYPGQIGGVDIILWKNGIVAAGAILTPASGALPLHHVDMTLPETPVTRSFSPRRDGWTPGKASAMEWRLSLGSTDSGVTGAPAFWSLDADDYRIVGWSAPANDVVELIRRPEWFTERSPVVGGGNNAPPPPRMWDIAQDSTGLLWVVGLSASANWREAWATIMRGARSSAGSGSKASELGADTGGWATRYRINLEVIDPGMARVITRLSLDENESFVSLLPSRRAVLYSEDSLGNPRLRVVQLEITERSDGTD